MRVLLATLAAGFIGAISPADADAHPNAMLNMSARNASTWLKAGRADAYAYNHVTADVLSVRTRRARCVPMQPWFSEEGGIWIKHAQCRARARVEIGYEECVSVYDEETGEYLGDDCYTVVEKTTCMRYRIVVHFIDWSSYVPPRAVLRFSAFRYKLGC